MSRPGQALGLYIPEELHQEIQRTLDSITVGGNRAVTLTALVQTGIEMVCRQVSTGSLDGLERLEKCVEAAKGNLARLHIECVRSASPLTLTEDNPPMILHARTAATNTRNLQYFLEISGTQAPLGGVVGALEWLKESYQVEVAGKIIQDTSPKDLTSG